MNKIQIEILIGFVILIVSFFISASYDFLEQLADISRKHEEYELDELVTLSFVLGILLIVFSVRRIIDLNNKRNELQNALNEIKTLKGIIPICSYCKNIRDDKGTWSRLEAYIQSHSKAEFSHGICPECYEQEKKNLKA